MTRFSRLTVLTFLAGLTGCSSVGHRNAAGNDAPLHLTAAMVSPVDIRLEWRDSDANAAGYVLEYTNDPKEDYVPLGFFPPDHKTFVHPRLMPETPFYYRVRPYYGPASNPVEVSLPKDLTDAAYVAAYAKPEDYHWAAPAIIPEDVEVTKGSIRNAASRAGAAPADLKAELVPSTVSGFKLTWTDHSTDEEGFFLEWKHEGSPEFFVCALVKPDVNSFGWAFEPPERKGSFRIRAYYYGKPSEVVMKITGKDPAFSE